MENKKITTTSKYEEAKKYIEEQLESHGWTSNCEDSCNLIQDLINKYEDLCQTIIDINDSNWKSKGTQFLVQYMEKINNE